MAFNMKKYQRRYYEKNKEKIKLQAKKWHKNNPKKSKLLSEKWKKNNPEKVREINRKGRKKYAEKKYKSKEFRELQLKAKHLMIDWANKKYIFGLKWEDVRLPYAPLNIRKIVCQKISHNRIKLTNESKCFNCKKTREKIKLEKHHSDYYYPLKIKILCYKCHRKVHK